MCDAESEEHTLIIRSIIGCVVEVRAVNVVYYAGKKWLCKGKKEGC